MPMWLRCARAARTCARSTPHSCFNFLNNLTALNDVLNNSPILNNDHILQDILIG